MLDETLAGTKQIVRNCAFRKFDFIFKGMA